MLVPIFAAVLLEVRSQDWTAVTIISSIALAGLLRIALGMSAEPDERRR
jgi:hypothetical protein